MPVPSLVTDLSATIASNSPAGSDNVFPDLDGYLRALSGFLASIRDNSGNGWVSPYLPLAGGTVTGPATFSSTVALNGALSGTGLTTYLASPPAIGGTAAAAVSSTNLSYTGTLTGGTGVVALGTNQFYKDASGNVGIGTATPATKLQVGDGTATTEIRIDGDGGSGNGSFIRGYKDTINPSWFVGDLNPIAGGTNSGLCFYSYGATPQVFYTNGLTRMTLDSSGNLGLGVTPSAWDSGYKAMQVGSAALFSNATGSGGYLLGNAYFGSGGYKYYNTAAATRYEMVSGAHTWSTAPSGTAGNAISFTQAMTLNANGKLDVPQNFVSSSGWQSNGTTYTTAAGIFNGVYGLASDIIAIATVGTERARIDSSGNMGLGATTISNSRFQIKGTSNNTAVFTDGMRITSNNETVETKYSWTGIDASSSLVLATGGSERARITSSGDLLVGTTNNSATAGVGAKILPAGRVFSVTDTTSDTYNYYSTTAAAYRFYVTSAGTIFATNTTISAISDRRFKENVRDLDVGLDAVMALKPRLYDWKEGKGADTKNARGFIAQEFEQVFPDLIDEWKDPAPEGEEPYKSVRQDLIPVLVKAIQEQQALITALTARVASLETQP